jgi:LCP family protein required for cell wall assembly
MPITRLGGMRVDIQRGVKKPNPGPPEYKVYRSRKKALGRLGGGDLNTMRRRLSRSRNGGRGGSAPPRERGPITAGRVVKWVGIAVAAWLALSLVLFLVSAQTQEGVSEETEKALSSGGSLLTGSTILVLGSDQRKGDSIDESDTGPGRSDSIMLVHSAFGSVRKLSIPRDVEADIPGHGRAKINAAYALGGPPLAIETVETFLGNGIEINHLVEVDFADFPAFIDSLGGITVNSKSKICSPPFDNFWKGIRFKKGENELDGRRALGFARVRKNPCAPAEDDRDRASRQQEVLRAISAQVKSPSTFFRLPWVSWNAPRALKSDMKGPGLMALFADVATGGTGDTEVIETSLCEQTGLCTPGNLFVSDGAKRDAVRKLVEGD